MSPNQDFKKGRRDFLRLLGIGGGAIFLNGVHLPPAFGDDIYPAEKIRWICSSKPGGGTDLVARCISPYLEKYLKEIKGAKGGEIRLENMPAAGGKKANNTIYHAKPDGYTFGDLNLGNYAEAMFTKSDYDFRKYSYVLRTGSSARLIVTKKNGFKSWDEMMKAAREKEVKWGLTSFGGGGHLTTILLKEYAKLPIRIINFPGSAEASNALLRGDVPVCIASDESAKGLLDAGELRVLLVYSDKSAYAGAPSLTDLGYPELAEASMQHRMIVAPPNLPREILDSLNSAFKKVFDDKEFLEQGKKVGYDPEPLYGQQAETMAKRIFKYYDGVAPILKKYLT